MADYRIQKGLEIPLEGEVQGGIETLDKTQMAPDQNTFALDLSPFPELRFKLLAKPGDHVLLGQPLVLDKQQEKRVFVSPCTGRVQEIKRGLKRRLLSIVVQEEEGKERTFSPVNPYTLEQGPIIERLLEGGLFPLIRQRPFDQLADPTKKPSAIFVNAMNTAPLAQDPALLIEEEKEHFQTGLTTLKRLTEGFVHLCYAKGATLQALTQAQDVERHTFSGPHPAGLTSTHIHYIDPILSQQQVVWTLDAFAVISIGYLMNEGKQFTKRLVALAGAGFEEGVDSRVFVILCLREMFWKICFLCKSLLMV